MDKQLNLELYRRMHLIRFSEETIKAHYLDDEMKTPMHMSMGGEAIAAGTCQVLTAEDQILGTYRSHAIYLAKTQETDQFFAEMYGKNTGLAQGKGGSMHLFAPHAGFMGTSAIVASNIPVAIGLAYANKLKQTQKTVAVYFGDGAIDEGAFWESLNAACLMKLKILFICEDNELAVHIPAQQRHGYQSISQIVTQFDCNVFSSQSTDVEDIYQLTKDAYALMEKNKKPCFLHLHYYRYLEHVGVFEDFKAGYRSREEFQTWYKLDPLQIQRNKLLKLFSESEVRQLEKQTEARVMASLKRAQDAPFPESHVAYEGVYA